MITRIEMVNCGPFRGSHAITLGEGAYAIVATHETDSRKSNGVGKSFILAMIDFAITGKLNPSALVPGADGWITNGEREASIALTLEDGAVIKRSKKRGQSTQVRFTAPGEKEAAQEDAAHAIMKHLAFSPDDFRNAAYFEQRKMARLVDPDQTKPSAALEIVSGWFGLGLAERAEEIAGDIASDNEKMLTALIAKHDAIESRWRDVPIEDVANLELVVGRLNEQLRALQGKRKEVRQIDKYRTVAEEQASRLTLVKQIREKARGGG
jgi:DNA repair exonuclease SbcCD ATPase subunit